MLFVNINGLLVYSCYKQLNENFIEIITEKIKNLKELNIWLTTHYQISDKLSDVSIKTIELE